MRFSTILLFFGINFLGSSLLFSMEEGIKKRKYEQREQSGTIPSSSDTIDLVVKATSYVQEEPQVMEHSYGSLDLSLKDPICLWTFKELLMEAENEKIPLHIILVTTFDHGKQQCQVRPFEFYSYVHAYLGNDFLDILFDNTQLEKAIEFADPTTKEKACSSLMLFKISPSSKQVTFIGYIPNIMNKEAIMHQNILISIENYIPHTWLSLSGIKVFLDHLYSKHFNEYLTRPSLFAKETWEAIMRVFQHAFSENITSEDDEKMLSYIIEYTLCFAFISPHVSQEDLDILFKVWYENKDKYKQVWISALHDFSLLCALHKNKDYAMTCLEAYDPEFSLDKALIRAKVAYYLRDYESAQTILNKFDNYNQHEDYDYAQFFREFIELRTNKDLLKDFFSKLNLKEFLDRLENGTVSIQEASKYIFKLRALIAGILKSAEEKSKLEPEHKPYIINSWKCIKNIVGNLDIAVDDHCYFIARIAQRMEDYSLLNDF